jgi:hypothetical protein
MEQTTTTTESTTAAAVRPTFLTVLCILSFIAAGLGIFGYIAAITAMGVVSAGVSAMENAGGTITSTGPSMAMTWAYVIIGFACTLVSLYGVIKMWKLQKIGFFLYVGASVVSMIMGIVYSGFGVMAVVFPILFIVLYGLNLKHLK